MLFHTLISSSLNADSYCPRPSSSSRIITAAYFNGQTSLSWWIYHCSDISSCESALWSVVVALNFSRVKDFICSGVPTSIDSLFLALLDFDLPQSLFRSLWMWIRMLQCSHVEYLLNIGWLCYYQTPRRAFMPSRTSFWKYVAERTSISWSEWSDLCRSCRSLACSCRFISCRFNSTCIVHNRSSRSRSVALVSGVRVTFRFGRINFKAEGF